MFGPNPTLKFRIMSFIYNNFPIKSTISFLNAFTLNSKKTYIKEPTYIITEEI